MAVPAAVPAAAVPPPSEAAVRFVEQAAHWFIDGRRLDMQGLADELGVSRATLFRHVGGREQLLTRAVWAVTERSLTVAAKRWERVRPAEAMHTIGSLHQFNAIVADSKGLRKLLDEEPALAMRVLTDPRGRIQTGVAAAIEALLRWDMEEFGLVPIIDPGDLAYALVRIGESFLYADVLAARTPDMEKANRLQRALVESSQAL